MPGVSLAQFANASISKLETLTNTSTCLRKKILTCLDNRDPFLAAIIVNNLHDTRNTASIFANGKIYVFNSILKSDVFDLHRLAALKDKYTHLMYATLDQIEKDGKDGKDGNHGNHGKDGKDRKMPEDEVVFASTDLLGFYAGCLSACHDAERAI